MGNKQNNHLIPNEKIKIKKAITTNFEDYAILKKKVYEENLIWLDSNINRTEYLLYQGQLIDIDKFELFLFTNINDCISTLKTIKYKKTYILISGELAKGFLEELDKIINEITVCPTIIIFTNKRKINIVKKDIISLKRMPLFDINLVFENFIKIKNKLKIEDKYKSKNLPPVDNQNYDNCFTFEYINENKDLIFPLTFTEYMEKPNKTEILKFNKFLLDKYYENDKIDTKFMKGIKKLENLINQLIIDTNIPIQILVKYWIRAYTFQSPFYREINLTLTKKLNNDFDIYIRALYYGLMTKSIESQIDKKLFRGSVIKLEEINYIKKALNQKKENLPGCICYNKAFFSTSLDEKVARSFMGNPNQDEMKVLYIIEKKNELDNENVTNIDVQKYSDFMKEKEIIFLPYSCFDIKDIKINKLNNLDYCEVYLSYIGKYKNQVDISQKIPERKFTQTILSSNVLKKLEMGKESNKNKFEFEINKYIPPELKQSYIIAVYDINISDINKKMQILNFDEKINKNEIQELCSIYLNGKKIEFTSEYTFAKEGQYTFKFEFRDLLIKANKLFYGCSSLISVNFSNFKSNYINDISDMFNSCNKLESLDLSNLETNEILSMKGLFKGCTSLQTLDLSNFNTDNVTDMSYMFCECESLTFLNLSNFKTKKVKTMYKIFYKCSSLFYINLSNFVSDNINNLGEMFSECSSLNYLDLSLFEINDNINTEKMFLNCAYFKSLKNEFISELTEINIENSIKKISNKFFSDESKIISKNIQSYTKNKKYKNIEILNQSIEEFIHEIKHINILVLGENKEEKNKLITGINELKKGNLNSINNNQNCFEIEYLKFYKEEEIDSNKMENIINNINKNYGDIIHFIWFCVTETKIKDNNIKLINNLISKYENKIVFFMIYLYQQENDNDKFLEFKENIKKTFTNKNYIIIHVNLYNIHENYEEMIINIKNNFINILFQNIIDNNNLYLKEKVKKRIEKIKADKNFDELPDSFSKYFEKLLGKRDDITQYLYQNFQNLLNYAKQAIDLNTTADFIDNFKKEKLKLKIKNTTNKKFDLENLDDELNKEIKKKYNQISQEYYKKRFKTDFFNFFSNYLTIEAKKIISQSIKNLNFEELKSFIEKNLDFEIN